jgi:hypothetical protein
MTVSSNLELLYKKYGDTWRLYEVKSDRILHLVSAQNEPDTSDLDSLVRDAHYDLVLDHTGFFEYPFLHKILCGGKEDA